MSQLAHVHSSTGGPPSKRRAGSSFAKTSSKKPASAHRTLQGRACGPCQSRSLIRPQPAALGTRRCELPDPVCSNGLDISAVAAVVEHGRRHPTWHRPFGTLDGTRSIIEQQGVGVSGSVPGRDGGPAASSVGSLRGRALTLTGVLAAAETAAPVEPLGMVARMLREHLGAVSVSFLITDFTGGSVVRLGAAGSIDTGEPARRITLRGTLYDDVIRTQQPCVEEMGEGRQVRVVAPVTNRRDAIGLLKLFLSAAPEAQMLQEIGESAHALAYLVIASRSFTGVYQWGRRTNPLSLAAEIRHRLLPASPACEAAQFAVAGALEPPITSGRRLRLHDRP